MNEDLEKAYEADKERKQVKNDELQAARDYVGVLLDEAEGRNQELKDKNEQTDALKARLDARESEYALLSKEHSLEKNKAKLAKFWMFFALGELLVIVILAVVLILTGGRLRSEKKTGSPAEDTDKEIGTEADVQQEEVILPVSRYVEDLESLASNIDTGDSTFSAKAETIDGLEYLVFSDGKLKICYKNEYRTDEKNYGKCMLIDNGTARYSFEKNYDLNGDLTKLVPILTNVNATSMTVLTEYPDNAQKTGFPQKLTIIDHENFKIYAADDPAELVRAIIKVEESEEASVYEDAPVVYNVTTPVAAYKFAVSESYYNEIAYNGYVLPDVESEAVFTIDKDGISFDTFVKLGDELYMGRATGGFSINGSSVTVSGARFGAFVPNNQEDPQLNGIIKTTDTVPDRYVTINGYNSERFFVAVDEEIPACSYDWERLDASDANDWKYYDADGNPAYVRGIDVSKYQGKIDWKKVKDAGVEFAIIRLGFRGMNQGTLELDQYYHTNMKNALENGIKVGVYFFSQAVNTDEAVEEADYVIGLLKDYKIEYPVVFDTERVTTFDARANILDMETRTALCRVFCEKIKEAGYKPMIYANTKYMIMGIDLRQLSDIDKWFAVYNDKITYPYDFQMLQYSESGSVDGVPANVDLDISFVDYSAAE